MNGRTHLLLGIASGVAVAAAVPAYTGLVFPGSDHVVKAGLILIAAIASLLPDIDHPKSILSGYAIGIGGAVRLFASHRTWTHSILFGAVICLGVWIASFQGAWLAPMIAVGMGFGSHLVADMLTVAGVPILLPFSRKSYRLAPAIVLGPTQWILESVATVAAVGAIGFIVWKGL